MTTEIEQAINPKHYKDHPSGLEAADVLETLPALLFNCCKYLWRLGKKDDKRQDFGKAMWYWNRWVEKMGTPETAKLFPKHARETAAQRNYTDWVLGLGDGIAPTDWLVMYIIALTNNPKTSLTVEKISKQLDEYKQKENI